MVVINKKVLKTDSGSEKEWGNPENPEKAKDERDMEKLVRQKKEAERNKKNLDTDEHNNKGDN